MVSHLFFADDLLLFYKVERLETSYVHEILMIFCGFSGQKINRKKKHRLSSH